jgi:hypothetical protein
MCAVVLSGCSEFLTGTGLTTDPNHPTSATARTLFVASEANVFAVQEGPLARAVCTWMQQCAGVNNQAIAIGTYDLTEGSFSWAPVYGGGGLIDLHRLEDDRLAAGDSTFAGIAMVLEEFLVGTAADLWGDIPYSQAVGESATPSLDAQQTVYESIQTRLSTAIDLLGKTSITNIGPTNADFVYHGDVTKWRALAYTLKARYYLHTAEKVGATAYQSALAAADSGISASANDYTSSHSGTSLAESNLWYQYTHAWPTLVGAGKYMADLLQTTSDPRLLQDYIPVPANPGAGIAHDSVIGASPGQTLAPGGTVSRLARYNTAMAPQPLVTWAENQLIIAEASYNLSDEPTALGRLNDVRADAGLGGVSLSGTPLLEAIMTEKYIREFENIEAFNDYRRTCVPALVPAPGKSQLPARLLYPLADRNTNPNIPAPSEQPARNWNDPNGC